MVGALHKKENKLLLILGGHKSHTHNLKVLERARKTGLIMLSLPPYTSRRMQPLDLTFFKPIKIYYFQQIDQCMRANPGRAVKSANFMVLHIGKLHVSVFL